MKEYVFTSRGQKSSSTHLRAALVRTVKRTTKAHSGTLNKIR
jgi:hypothetical protein